MRKVDMYKATWETHHEELPEECPKCGSDFTDDESLIEENYMATEQTCCLDADGLNYEETTIEDFSEAQYTTGYKCAACKHQILDVGDAVV